MKHCLECLIYLLNQNKKDRLNRRVKSSKSMLYETGYPNLLHVCDSLCFNYNGELLMSLRKNIERYIFISQESFNCSSFAAEMREF